MKIQFFKTPGDFRRWLEKHHATSSELWVAYYKKGSGRPSISYPESVDEALCFGWIDGIKKSVDDLSYTHRFTPRKSNSIWSTINIKRAQALIEQGLMQPAGERAFRKRKDNKVGIYSYEDRSDKLPKPYETILKSNKAAWDFFQSQTASYRRAVGWWIVSAKKEETRLKRMEKLIEDSVNGRAISEFFSVKKTK